MYTGKIGRIFFIHSPEEIWVQIEEGYREETTPKLSDALSVECLKLIEPAWSGYMKKYSSTYGIYKTWKLRYIEVWADKMQITARASDTDFDYKSVIKIDFDSKVCSPTIGANYDLPPDTDIRRLGIVQHGTKNDMYFYVIADTVRQVKEFNEAVNTILK